MICSLCRNTAWYRVGKHGYCGEHRTAAVEANKLDTRRVDARARLRFYSQTELEERRQNIARASGWEDRCLPSISKGFLSIDRASEVARFVEHLTDDNCAV